MKRIIKAFAALDPITKLSIIMCFVTILINIKYH